MKKLLLIVSLSFLSGCSQDVGANSSYPWRKLGEDFYRAIDTEKGIACYRTSMSVGTGRGLNCVKL